LCGVFWLGEGRGAGTTTGREGGARQGSGLGSAMGWALPRLGTVRDALSLFRFFVLLGCAKGGARLEDRGFNNPSQLCARVIDMKFMSKTVLFLRFQLVFALLSRSLLSGFTMDDKRPLPQNTTFFIGPYPYLGILVLIHQYYHVTVESIALSKAFFFRL